MWQVAEAWSEAMLTMVMFALGYLAFSGRSARGKKVAASTQLRHAADIAIGDLKEKSPFDKQLKRKIAVGETDHNKSSGHEAEHGFEKGLVALPGELCGKVAWALGLTDIGACAAVSRSFREQLWESPEVWQVFAGGHGLLAQPGALSPKSGRDAFRRAHFHTNGERLRQPSVADSVSECMYEAALIVQGLLPADGAGLAETACAAGERALREHDPADLASAAAAMRLLAAAYRRSDVISAAQLGRLESANSSAFELRELIDSAFEEHLHQAEAQAANALDHAAEEEGALSSSPFWWSEDTSGVAETHERWIESEQVAEMLQCEIRYALFYD